MKTYTAEELALIVEKHKKWLLDEDGGEIADLSNANLRSSDLRSSDLSNANLYNANLYNADFRGIGGREINTFLSVAGIGRERRQTLWWVEEDSVWCGCFKGTMQQFESKVTETHGESLHGQNYRDAIDYLKKVAGRIGRGGE